MNQNYDVLIIGGGPAGCSAAMYLAHNGWTTLLVDKSLEQGFLGTLKKVKCFPGFPDATNGSDIIKRMRRQVEGFSALVKRLEVQKIDLKEKPYKATAGDQIFEIKSMIIATGASERTAYSIGEKEYLGRGVSHNVRQDGIMTYNKEVVIAGKSKQTAIEAIFLSKYAKKIYFVIPSNKLDLDPQVLKELEKNSKIELLYSTSLKNIKGQDRVSSVVVFSGGQEKELQVSFVFDLTHDYKIINPFIKEALEIDPKSGIPVNQEFHTKIPGVFACGDVLCAKPQEPLVSLAQGLIAGMNAHKYLLNNK